MLKLLKKRNKYGEGYLPSEATEGVKKTSSGGISSKIINKLKSIGGSVKETVKRQIEAYKKSLEERKKRLEELEKIKKEAYWEAKKEAIKAYARELAKLEIKEKIERQKQRIRMINQMFGLQLPEPQFPDLDLGFGAAESKAKKKKRRRRRKKKKG